MSTKDPGLSALLTLILKQLANNTMRVRQLMGMTVTTWLLPSDDALPQALTKQGEDFAQAARESRSARLKTDKSGSADAKPAPLGPPTLGMFIVFLQTLLTLEVGGENRKKIAALMESYAECDETPPDLEAIGMCRLESGRDSTHVKLLVAMSCFPARSVVNKAMEQAGYTAMRGAAPSGWMEEEIGDWISALEA